MRGNWTGRAVRLGALLAITLSGALTSRAQEAGEKPVSKTIDPRIQQMKDQGEVVYLGNQIGVWTPEDAESTLGKPQPENTEDPLSGILKYQDPTKAFREIDLGFDQSQKLRDVYLYPYNLTWQDCRKQFGTHAKIAMKHKDGSATYAYEDRHLNVLVDSHGRVIDLGLY